MVFKAKIAWYIHATIVLMLLLTVGSLVGAFIVKNNVEKIVFWSTLGLMLIIDLFLLPMLYRIKYSFFQNGIIISSGLLNKVIAYKLITSVKETRNPLASPYAPSLDRIEIKFKDENGKDHVVLVSPQNKCDFILELNNRRGVK